MINGIIIFLLDYHLHFFESILNKTKKQGSTHRLSFWKDFINNQFSDFHFKEFFFGSGALFKNFKYNTVHDFETLHNFVLEVWGRYGILACISLLVSLIYIIIKNFRLKEFHYLNAIPVAILFHNLFEDYVFFNSFCMEILFFFFILLAPSYLNHTEKKME